MSSSRSLLVVGATGKQGGALISALLAQPSQPFEILALTRSKASAGSQRLAAKPNVKVIEGDLDHVEAVFEQVKKPLWGLFIVPVLDKGIKKEEEQGRAITEAAIKAGVSHIVFTGTDRGVDGEDIPTPVPHFASKFRTEQFIKGKAAESNGKLTYTFLRPVSFMENFEPGFFGSAHLAMWKLDGDSTKLQMVAVKDVGKVAADAFLHAEEPRYKNNAVSLVGDSLSAAETEKIFKEETGRTLPQTYWIVAVAVRYLIYDLRQMYAWFNKTGFGADQSSLKKEYPYLKDFRTWLREDSAHKK